MRVLRRHLHALDPWIGESSVWGTKPGFDIESREATADAGHAGVLKRGGCHPFSVARAGIALNSASVMRAPIAVG